MLTEILTKDGNDTKGALVRFLNNTALYEQFLHRFPEDENMKLLREAVARKDAEAAFSAAHAMKGLCGNLGLTSLYQSTSRMVELFRAKRPEDAFAMLEGIDREYVRLSDIIASDS